MTSTVSFHPCDSSRCGKCIIWVRLSLHAVASWTGTCYDQTCESFSSPDARSSAAHRPSCGASRTRTAASGGRDGGRRRDMDSVTISYLLNMFRKTGSGAILLFVLSSVTP